MLQNGGARGHPMDSSLGIGLFIRIELLPYMTKKDVTWNRSRGWIGVYGSGEVALQVTVMCKAAICALQ